MFKKLLAVFVILVSFATPLLPVPALATPSADVVISEVIAGTSAGASQEMVELYNAGGVDIYLSNWKVAFVSSSNVQKDMVTLSGILPHGQVAILASSGFQLPDGKVANWIFADSSMTYNGHLIIKNQQDTVVDMVGWGTALSFEGQTVAMLSGGKSLHRYSDCNGNLVDADNNSLDFYIDQNPSPGSITTATLSACDVGQAKSSDCELAIITEILPNPAGTDSGNEYIEIFNPGPDAIDMAGCSLSVDGKTFDFSTGTVLQAGEYRAFYDDLTGLTLPNSAGGQVSLYSDNVESVVEYPGNLSDDISWVLIDSVWQQTNQLTPHASNLAPLVVVGGQGADELESCPEGKYRNPETNRCKTIENNELQACDVGQERNPETNRCRKAGSDSSSLAPCEQGQERNPETNRCRKIAGASTLAPCQPGYERNPETNRCRKVGSSGATSALTNTAIASQNPVSYPVIGITSALAMGYGVFEYRHDIRNWLSRLRSK